MVGEGRGCGWWWGAVGGKGRAVGGRGGEGLWVVVGDRGWYGRGCGWWWGGGA